MEDTEKTRVLNDHPEVVTDYIAMTYGEDFLYAMNEVVTDFVYNAELPEDKCKALFRVVPFLGEDLKYRPKYVIKRFANVWGADFVRALRKVCTIKKFDASRSLSSDCVLTDTECKSLIDHIPGLEEYVEQEHYSL